MNKCFLAGNLTRDPELRTTKSDNKVVNFGVAVKGRTKEDVIFVDCEAWSTGAEFIEKYFKKGDGIVIDGSLRQESWEKDGVKRTKLVVRCDHCSFPPGKGKKNEGASDEPTNVETGSGNTKPADDGDIPF